MPVIKVSVAPISQDNALAAVPAGTVQDLLTIADQSGSVAVVVEGNGHALVDIEVVADGVVDGTTPSNVKAEIVTAFEDSLVVRRRNNDGVIAHNASAIETRGLKS